jgi:hypothetical protein
MSYVVSWTINLHSNTLFRFIEVLFLLWESRLISVCVHMFNNAFCDFCISICCCIFVFVSFGELEYRLVSNVYVALKCVVLWYG